MIKIFGVVLLVVAVQGALLGSKKCTWGPSYWCSSFAKADECGAKDHCTKYVWSKMSTIVGAEDTAEVDDSDSCTFCKDMVADVKNFLEKNSTKATILQYWNRACDFMPDQYSRSECVKVEQHYLDQFEQCVKDNMDPATLCKLAQLCGKNDTKTEDKTVQAVQLKPAAQLARVQLAKSSPVKVGSADSMCDVCKASISMMAQMIKDPNNQKTAENFLIGECAQLGQGMAKECQSLVTEYFPQLVQLLENELTDQICYTAGICTNANSHGDMSSALSSLHRVLGKWLDDIHLKNGLQAMAVRLGNEECDLCEEVAGYLKIFLNNNQTEQEAIMLIKNDVCSQLGQFASACDQLADQYGPQLYADLLQFLDPASLCSRLGLCTSSAPAVKKVKARASPQCIVCEFVMKELDGMLADNATEEEIINTVDKICTILPSSIKSECDDLIRQYGPAIINLLVRDAAPGVVCSFLGLCSSGDSQYKLPLRSNGEDCFMCELAMGYLKSFLKKNATEEEIMQALEKVCNYLSGSLAQECNTMIEKYAPQIINMLANDMEAKEICVKLGMCSAVKRMKVDGLVHLYNSESNV